MRNTLLISITFGSQLKKFLSPRQILFRFSLVQSLANQYIWNPFLLSITKLGANGATDINFNCSSLVRSSTSHIHALICVTLFWSLSQGTIEFTEKYTPAHFLLYASNHLSNSSFEYFAWFSVLVKFLHFFPSSNNTIVQSLKLGYFSLITSKYKFGICNIGYEIKLME